MITYQDYEERLNNGESIESIIDTFIGFHKSSDEYKLCLVADEYDAQRNTTILQFVQMIFSVTGERIVDPTASNNKICSNFFHRLNTQRNTYLLGNGVSFADNKEEVINEDGTKTTVDHTKEALGPKFDTDLKDAGYKALIHGVSFGFWNLDRLQVFKLTEFVPLWDEDTGDLRAGIRFWQLDKLKPVYAVFYEVDGYTKYKKVKSDPFVVVQEKRPYKQIVQKSEADGEEIVGGENYPGFPIVPFWGSKLHQSTIVGMRGGIDSFDLIRCGFANDLTDCAQIYWLIGNAGGMNDDELARFRDRLKLNHIAVADTENSTVTPYTQEIPSNARKIFLDDIRSGIYEDFGGLDVHTVAAGATNDHIDAAYQPLDEEADDYEYQVIEFIQRILALQGIEDTPIFKRNRISNQKEMTDMILSAAEYLDDETILNKLPFVSVDEVSAILAKKDEETADMFEQEEPEDEFPDEDNLGLDDLEDDMDADAWGDDVDAQIDELEKLLEE
jgi:hypothetical protein